MTTPTEMSELDAPDELVQHFDNAVARRWPKPNSTVEESVEDFRFITRERGQLESGVKSLRARLEDTQREPAWLAGHCRAIGMTRTADQTDEWPSMHTRNVALFTIDLKERAEAAEAEAAALREDAERYRWIRVGRKGTYNTILIHAGSILDAAIDAAQIDSPTTKGAV